jgi:sialate O-acetylesterase
VLATLSVVRARTAEPVRVACLGDSITAGARVDAATQSYPVQLQRLLGPAYLVKNFGHGGATLWRGGKPNAFQQIEPAVGFAPDIAMVMFGINDTRSAGVEYWSHFGELERDATALLEAILAAPSKPQIVLCLPTANLPDFPGLTDERQAVLKERLPRLEAVRSKLISVAERFAARGVSVVELHGVTARHPELFNADAVHFNPAGYRFIAETLHPHVLAAARARASRRVTPRRRRTCVHFM